MSTVPNPGQSSSLGSSERPRRWLGGKSVWDGLDLLAKLAIPVILGIATLLLGIQQANLAQQQHDNDQKIANQQRLQDQAIALDQQRQATLVTYLDDMRDLLLNRGLLTSKPSDEIRVIALTETLTAMRQLDGKRNSFLVQFLQDTHLIGNSKDDIVSFRFADISSTNLSNADLYGVDFRNANLSLTNLDSAIIFNANLSGANLYKSILIGASLKDANLSRTILIGANLIGAELFNVDLSGADLSGADLSHAGLSYAHLNNAALDGANLSGTALNGADLTDAKLTQQQLDQVDTCGGAILPKGLICHHTQIITP